MPKRSSPYTKNDLVPWNDIQMRNLGNFWKVMTKVQRAEFLKKEGLDFCLTAGIRPKDEILELAGIDLAQLDERRIKILRSPVPKLRPRPKPPNQWKSLTVLQLPYYRKYLPEMWLRTSAATQIEFLSTVGLEPCLEVGIRPADKILSASGIDPKSINWPEAPTVRPAKWDEIPPALQELLHDMLRDTWDERTDAEIVEFIKTYGYEIGIQACLPLKDRHLIKAGLNPDELDLQDPHLKTGYRRKTNNVSEIFRLATTRWEDLMDWEHEVWQETYPNDWRRLHDEGRILELLRGALSMCRMTGVRPSDEVLRQAGIDLEFVDWEDTTGLDY